MKRERKIYYKVTDATMHSAWVREALRLQYKVGEKTVAMGDSGLFIFRTEQEAKAWNLGFNRDKRIWKCHATQVRNVWIYIPIVNGFPIEEVWEYWRRFNKLGAKERWAARGTNLCNIRAAQALVAGTMIAKSVTLIEEVI